MNDFVKSKIKWKNQLYKIYTKNGNKCNDYLRLKEASAFGNWLPVYGGVGFPKLDW